MSLDMPQYPLGSKLPLVENHWPAGGWESWGDGWWSRLQKHVPTRPLPATLEVRLADVWPREAAWGVSCCHLLRSLLITLAVDERPRGNPLHCVGGLVAFCSSISGS